jgi:hypothetical protein
MKLARRTFLQFAGAAAATPAFPHIAKAQVYPSRPITMIVPFAAGLGRDGHRQEPRPPRRRGRKKPTHASPPERPFVVWAVNVLRIW